MIAATIAEEARLILESDAYQLAVQNAETDRIRQWRACKQGTEQREAHWHALQNIDSITKQLRIIAEKPLMEASSG